MLVDDVRRNDRVKFLNWTWFIEVRPTSKNCPPLTCLAGGTCAPKTEHVSWYARSPVGTVREVYAPLGTEVEAA